MGFVGRWMGLVREKIMSDAPRLWMKLEVRFGR